MSIPVALHDLLAQWDLYKSTVNDFFAIYLTQIDSQIDFWKSITASHILAGARHVARKVTELSAV